MSLKYTVFLPVLVGYLLVYGQEKTFVQALDCLEAEDVSGCIGYDHLYEQLKKIKVFHKHGDVPLLMVWPPFLSLSIARNNQKIMSLCVPILASNNGLSNKKIIKKNRNIQKILALSYMQEHYIKNVKYHCYPCVDTCYTFIQYHTMLNRSHLIELKIENIAQAFSPHE